LKKKKGMAPPSQKKKKNREIFHYSSLHGNPPSNCGTNVTLRDEAPIHEQDHLRVPCSAGCHKPITRTFLATVPAQCRESNTNGFLIKVKNLDLLTCKNIAMNTWVSGGKAPPFLGH